MDKIIFLDIDGVLNCSKTFKESFEINRHYRKYMDNSSYIYKLKCMLSEISVDKVRLVKEIVDNTGAKIVITSAWRKLRLFPLIEEYLVNKGLPIIDHTINTGYRGEEIKKYINDNNIKDFIVIDDEIFDDYDDFILNRLIKTSFYEDGINEEHIEEAIKILKK